jgi:hypothetical protein
MRSAASLLPTRSRLLAPALELLSFGQERVEVGLSQHA